MNKDKHDGRPRHRKAVVARGLWSFGSQRLGFICGPTEDNPPRQSLGLVYTLMGHHLSMEKNLGMNTVDEQRTKFYHKMRGLS